jgi:hypothetical protein
MNIINKINHLYMLYSLIFIYFVVLLLDSLLRGGRWDLNEHIAFANRILENGQLYYSNGDSDLYTPSSPYFPGVGFLAYILMYFGISIFYTSYILLILAWAIGIAYFISIFYTTKILYPKLNETVILYILTFIFIFNFPVYKQYMLEFKPDTLLLLFMMLIFNIGYSKDKIDFKGLFFITIILFLSISMKQTFFFVYLTAFIIFLFNNNMTNKSKTYFIIFTFVWTLIAMYFLFSFVENLKYYTIDIMSKHIMDFPFFIGSIKGFVVNNLIFGIFLFIYLVKYMKYDIVPIKININKLQYLFIALLYASFSIIGAMKTGGNSGNLEVGFIAFIPFVIYSIYNLLIIIKNKISITTKIMKILNYAFLILFIMIYSVKLSNTYVLLLESHKRKIDIIENLRNHFNESSYFLVNGTTLLYVLAAGFNNISEKGTISHYNNTILYDMPKLISAIKNKKYDLILLNNTTQKEFTPVFNYTKNTKAMINIRRALDNNYNYSIKCGLYFYKKKGK